MLHAIAPPPWLDYVPVVTPGTGAFGAAPTVAGRYRRFGNTIEGFASWDIANNGTAGGWTSVTMPTNGVAGAIMDSPVDGMNKATNALLAGVLGAGAGIVAITAGGAYSGANGQKLVINFKYEV